MDRVTTEFIQIDGGLRPAAVTTLLDLGGDHAVVVTYEANHWVCTAGGSPANCPLGTLHDNARQAPGRAVRVGGGVAHGLARLGYHRPGRPHRGAWDRRGDRRRPATVARYGRRQGAELGAAGRRRARSLPGTEPRFRKGDRGGNSRRRAVVRGDAFPPPGPSGQCHFVGGGRRPGTQRRPRGVGADDRNLRRDCDRRRNPGQERF